MIRDFKIQDIDRIMELWLDTNRLAHDFINDEYWQKSYEPVKAMMPKATIYVYEEDKVIKGFVGLMDNYIAGIFIAQSYQSKGIGKQLLDYVKNKKTMLSLSVYKKNKQAIQFYLRENFKIIDERIEETTGEIEFNMNWIKGE
ncbi:N-acetyltransferase [Anaerorhabdus sp.]|uniref:N-acetyltransferase n=1 Tax=Anaerorhabdus sp. TaxID=1872524 RepID=UPI002FCC4A92